MTVKILIKRHVPEGKAEELRPLLLKLRTLANSQEGYITGETLRKLNHPRQSLVISTWQSVEHWKAWERDPEREKIQLMIDTLLQEKTEYEVFVYA